MFWFTSDTHAFHTNIIKHSNRPFSSVAEMNETMANNINKKAKAGDILVHLGDWSLGHKNVPLFREMINCGRIILILGNHDKHIKKYPECFEQVYPFWESKFEGQRITLCHYAMRVWNKSHYGAWHLYGHSHGSLKDNPNSLSFDIGVDCHNFQPLCMDEIREIMQRKEWQPIDHHAPRQ